MKYLRKKRGLAGLGALVAVVAVTGFVVLPALASNPGDLVLPTAQPSGVTPTDKAVGGNGNCSNLFGIDTGASTGYYEYDNSNPKTATGLPSGNNDGVTFDITMPTGKDHDKYFSFVAHGAAVVAVGVNGGSDSTIYDYRTTSGGPGPVTADGAMTGQPLSQTGLHAPAQAFTSTTNGSTTTEDPSQLYSVSHLTFCYEFGTVAGTVYQDNSPYGPYDSTTDVGLANWTVNLYDSAGNLVSSTKSGTDGTYKLSAAFTDSSYTVCEAPPSGTWAQTEPTSNSVCSGSGELPQGYTLSPGSLVDTITGRDFGNVPAITCTSGSSFGPADYQVGTCKQGQTYVFSSGGGGTTGTPPYVAYWVGDASLGQVATVEKVTFPDPIDATTGQPTYTKLMYNDDATAATISAPTTQMPYCNLDPRSGGDFTLNSLYTSVTSSPSSSGSGAVIPGGATSCAISIRTYVDASGNGWLEAYDYTIADPVRGMG